MKPNFESPIDTPRELVERGIKLYMPPGTQIWSQWLSQSDIPEYRKIAETMNITESWDQFIEMTKNEFLSQGTHARMASVMVQYWFDLSTEYDHDQGKYRYNHGRGFYRGEKLSGKNPMAGYLTHKKWHLNEVGS